MADEALRAVEKVWFTNLVTLEERDVQFNPVELSHSIAAEYTLFTAVGASYQPQQYSHTTNREFSVTLQFKVEGEQELDDFSNTFNFLTACLHPFEYGGAPPEVLFTWPNLASVIVRILSLNTKHVQFDAQLHPTRTDIDVVMRTIRKGGKLYDEVRENGLME
jgi:hypothetical protein